MPEPQPVKRRQNLPSTPTQPWYAWVEPWYLSYALLGTVSAGLLPIVMPLLVSRQGSATEVGLVMAALNVSGLLAPLWGWLADRYRLHRWILIAGLGLAALGIALFAFVANSLLWAGLALTLNLGVIAAATVANLFVVERHPRAEWDERLGWLQTAYGGGQVLGLLLAALVSQADLRLGFGLASLSCVLALAIAAKFVQTPPAPLPAAVVLRHPVKHTDGMFSSPQQLFHHLNPATLRKVRAILATPFSLWMGAWLVAASGAGAFFRALPDGDARGVRHCAQSLVERFCRRGGVRLGAVCAGWQPDPSPRSVGASAAIAGSPRGCVYAALDRGRSGCVALDGVGLFYVCGAVMVVHQRECHRLHRPIGAIRRRRRAWPV